MVLSIATEIAASGPMPFDRFVDLALYDDADGFYATSGRAGGRRGDFVTSVEVGPLFAAVIADWLDGLWQQADQPEEFRVAEVGAGVGTLFRGIDRAAPACLDALAYTLVERSATMRSAHQSLPGEGWQSAAELPAVRQHVVLANELLDNLGFGIAERVDGGWGSVTVVLSGPDLDLETSAPDPQLRYLEDLAPAAAVGHRVPLAIAAAEWVETVQANTDHLLVFDYAATTAELADRGQPGWLRTYAAHERGDDPLVDIGQRDITHDVPIDQLPTATAQTLQAEWLVTNGLSQRVDAARQVWKERAHIGDLEAMTARSAINEAKALTDRAGLGGFWVLEWEAS